MSDERRRYFPAGSDLRAGLVGGADNGGWKTDFSPYRTEVIAGSATLAPRSALFETHFQNKSGKEGRRLHRCYVCPSVTALREPGMRRRGVSQNRRLYYN